MNTYTQQHGFTLIELITVIAIIGIITAIALPLYDAQVRKQRRTEAISAISRINNELTEEFSDKSTYANYVINSNLSTNLRYYSASMQSLTASSYTIQLAPQGEQTKDTDCGTFKMDEKGIKSITGTASTVAACWGSN